MNVSTDILPFTDVLPFDLVPSTDLLPYVSSPWSRSEKFEKFESLGVEFVSKLSNVEYMRSVLGLPELVNDMSLFGLESSYGLPFGPFLVNGDLLSMIDRLN